MSDKNLATEKEIQDSILTRLGALEVVQKLMVDLCVGTKENKQPDNHTNGFLNHSLKIQVVGILLNTVVLALLIHRVIVLYK